MQQISLEESFKRGQRCNQTEEDTTKETRPTTSSQMQVQVASEEKQITTSTNTKAQKDRPQWQMENLKAIRGLRKKIEARYQKELPDIENCKSACLTQVFANEMYFRFLIDTLEAAGDRGDELFDKILISEGIKQIAAITNKWTDDFLIPRAGRRHVNKSLP